MEYHIRFDKPKKVLHLLDQRFLPGREDYFACKNTDDIVYALQTMVVRGAPAIGVCAAWGCVLAACEVATMPGVPWSGVLEGLLKRIAEARPTAVNLKWAVDRMAASWASAGEIDLPSLIALWVVEAESIHKQDIEINRTMGHFGAECIADGDTVMTHCNAGALATAGYGTALGVIRAAVEQGKKVSVISNETRPFLQGARLTAYELHVDGIPVTIACDNACGLLMQRGMVQSVVVGADRIAANGDTANKIGTYSVALIAHAHNVPFYIAAPLSTIDRDCTDGSRIPIEVRPDREVTHIADRQITPEGVPVYNFAFDVTPAELISGIITEKGILRPPYAASIKDVFEKK